LKSLYSESKMSRSSDRRFFRHTMNPAVKAAAAINPIMVNVAAIAPVFLRKLFVVPELVFPAELASIVSMGSTAVGDVVNCPIFVAIKVVPPLLRVEGIPETSKVVPVGVVDVVLEAIVAMRVDEVEVVVGVVEVVVGVDVVVRTNVDVGVVVVVGVVGVVDVVGLVDIVLVGVGVVIGGGDVVGVVGVVVTTGGWETVWG